MSIMLLRMGDDVWKAETTAPTDDQQKQVQ